MTQKAYYEVQATITDAAIADRWLHWMQGEHLADVINAGAISARLIALDARIEFIIQYEFDSKDALEVYFKESAPALREKGLAKFGTDAIVYSRRTGVVALRLAKPGEAK